MPCSLRGTNIEALHNPTVRTSIMSEFLAKNLLGNKPLIPTNKLFKSPSGLIFEYFGIVRDVPIKINETKVHLDFQIFAILDFELLIGYPFEKLFQEKLPMVALVKNFGKVLPPLILVKWNAHQHPRSNQSHAPLTIQMLFSIMVEIQH